MSTQEKKTLGSMIKSLFGIKSPVDAPQVDQASTTDLMISRSVGAIPRSKIRDKAFDTNEIPDVLMQPMPLAATPKEPPLRVKPEIDPIDAQRLTKGQIKHALDRIKPSVTIITTPEPKPDLSNQVAKPFGSDPFSDLDNPPTLTIGRKSIEMLKSDEGNASKPKAALSNTSDPYPEDTPKVEIKPIESLKMGRLMGQQEISTKTAEQSIASSAEEVVPPTFMKEIGRDLNTLRRLESETRQNDISQAPEQKSDSKDRQTATQTTPKPAKEGFEYKHLDNAEVKSQLQSHLITREAVQSRQLTNDNKKKLEFLSAVDTIDIPAEASIDLDSYLKSPSKVMGLRNKISQEKTMFKPLVKTVLGTTDLKLDFDSPLTGELAEPEKPSLFEEDIFEEWLSLIEHAHPPLYKTEVRIEPSQIHKQIKQQLDLIPLLGRQVTLGSVLSSWMLMDKGRRPRVLTLQPDFIRVDDKEFLEHELFLGQSHMPYQRCHGLFRAKAGSCGSISEKNVHLIKLKTLVDSKKSLEESLSQSHDLLHRSFKDPAFYRWTEPVLSGQSTGMCLIEEYAHNTVNKYKISARRILRNAEVLSKVVKSEFCGTGEGRENYGFNMRFLESNGFLPSSSFYDFLELPVNKTQGEAKPLWQALSDGEKPQFKDIGFEDFPMDYLLIHLFGILGSGQTHSRSFDYLLSIMDTLIRTGDYSAESEINQKSDDQDENRAYAVLKAYEQILQRGFKEMDGPTTHQLGSYRNLRNIDAEPDSLHPYVPSTISGRYEHLFGDIKDQMKQSGLWREDLEKFLWSIGEQG